MRPLRLLSWGILVVMIAVAIASYAQLPDRIPMHIGLDGRASDFRSKSLFNWFVLPGIATLLQLLIEGLTVALPARPELFNFPDKQRFLALPREFQAPVIREMRTMLDVTRIGIQAVLLLVLFQLRQAAMGARAPGGPLVILLLALLLTPVVLIWLTRVTAAVDREERRWREAGAPPH